MDRRSIKILEPMKTTTITYTYDPVARNLTIFENGKARGGFIGHEAERRFENLLGSGAEIKITNMNTDAIRKMKVRKLRALWIKQGIDHYRCQILEKYEVKSTSDLNDTQLDELINRYSHENYPPASDEVRKIRSEVLSVVNKLGIYETNFDWSRVNAYLMNPRIAGKLLYQMNLAELIDLKRKLYSILSKHDKNAKEITRQQLLN